MDPASCRIVAQCKTTNAQHPTLNPADRDKNVYPCPRLGVSEVKKVFEDEDEDEPEQPVTDSGPIEVTARTARLLNLLSAMVQEPRAPPLPGLLHGFCHQ